MTDKHENNLTGNSFNYGVVNNEKKRKKKELITLSRSECVKYFRDEKVQ